MATVETPAESERGNIPPRTSQKKKRWNNFTDSLIDILNTYKFGTESERKWANNGFFTGLESEYNLNNGENLEILDRLLGNIEEKIEEGELEEFLSKNFNNGKHIIERDIYRGIIDYLSSQGVESDYDNRKVGNVIKDNRRVIGKISKGEPLISDGSVRTFKNFVRYLKHNSPKEYD